MHRPGIPPLLLVLVAALGLALVGACTQASPTPTPTGPGGAATSTPTPPTATAVAPTPTSESMMEPLAGLIVFAENGRIGLTHPATGDSVFVTSGPGDYSPVWSPDGSKLAFTRFFPVEDAGTYVMNRDGSGETKVSDISNIYNLPVWSPDGTRLSLINRRPGPEMGLWVVSADGSAEPIRVHPATGPMQHVAWSPNSDKIAFTYNMATRGDGLFIVPADGSAEAVITIPADANYLTRAGALDWSPDGRHVAVRSWPLVPAGMPPEESFVDGTDQILSIIRIADDNTATVLHRAKGMANGDWYPAFAPNGLTIAVIIEDEMGMHQLAVASLLSGEVYPLDLMADALGTPSWSPDGGRILTTAYTMANPDGSLQMLQLEDIGMEWNMAMDMTMDMRADTVSEVRSGFYGMWAPSADVDTLPDANVEAAPMADDIRVAAFTFSKYS